MNIPKFSNSLIMRKGIWFSKKSSKIFFPDDGNSNCYRLEKNSYWFNHRNQCIISLIKAFSPQETVLDIGGGNGFVSRGLQSNGIMSILLEPNIIGVMNAKQRGLKNLICSSLQNAQINEESINAAGAFDVIEHIEDDVEFLKIINSILKKRGMLYITIPAYQLLWSNDDIFACHFRRYTQNSIRLKLEKAGYRIRYFTYIFSILVLPIFLFRKVPSVLTHNKKKNIAKYEKEFKLHGGFIEKIFNKSFKWELSQINNLKTVPFGSSCLLAAEKL